ncbi:MAG: response regulator [Bacteriovoracaceae bacterium]|nr:response regulator [Bacteriovoracaceae bacterium]
MKTMTQKYKILVIDDDAEVMNTLTNLIKLEILGSQVEARCCPLKGLETLKISHYDLVITDQKMPKLRGTELLNLADKVLTSYTPFIIYTGSSELINPIEITSKHFYAIVEKPRHSELVKAIKRIKLETILVGKLNRG